MREEFNLDDYNSFEPIDTPFGEQVKAQNDDTGRSILLSHEQVLAAKNYNPEDRHHPTVGSLSGEAAEKEVHTPDLVVPEERQEAGWEKHGYNPKTGETILRKSNPEAPSGYDIKRVPTAEAASILAESAAASDESSDQEQRKRGAQTEQALSDMVHPENIGMLRERIEKVTRTKSREHELRHEKLSPEEISKIEAAMIEAYAQTGRSKDNPREVPDHIRTSIEKMLGYSDKELEALLTPKEVTDVAEATPTEADVEEPLFSTGDKVRVFRKGDQADEGWQVVGYSQGRGGRKLVDLRKGEETKRIPEDKLEWWQSLQQADQDEAIEPRTDLPEPLDNETSPSVDSHEPAAALDELQRVEQDLHAGQNELLFEPGQRVRAFSLQNLAFEEDWLVSESYEKDGEKYVRLTKKQGDTPLTKEVRAGELEAWQADDLFFQETSPEQDTSPWKRVRNLWRKNQEAPEAEELSEEEKIRIQKKKERRKKILRRTALGLFVVSGAAGTIPGIPVSAYLIRRYYRRSTTQTNEQQTS